MFEVTRRAQARLAIVCGAAASALPLGAASCEALAQLALPQTTITTAVSMPAGDFTPPGGRPLHSLPAFCRVAGTIQPMADSNIQFEVWMPASGWNGKFHGAGNGGFAGDINYAEMASVIGHGYAAASTDTGHRVESMARTMSAMSVTMGDMRSNIGDMRSSMAEMNHNLVDIRASTSHMANTITLIQHSTRNLDAELRARHGHDEQHHAVRRRRQQLWRRTALRATAIPMTPQPHRNARISTGETNPQRA